MGSEVGANTLIDYPDAYNYGGVVSADFIVGALMSSASMLYRRSRQLARKIENTI